MKKNVTIVFQKGQIMKACNSPILLCSKCKDTIITVYTKYGKTSPVKKSSWWKQRCPNNTELLQTANLSIHLEDPVSTKTDNQELHKANIHERAAIDKTLITDKNAKMPEI